jgi:hypothetical protein
MEISHRITFGHIDAVDDVIEDLKIKHKRSPLPGGAYLIHIDMLESDPRWPQLAKLVRDKGALDMYDTKFRECEILEAQWVRALPAFQQVYPRPEENMEWKQITYENACPKCGVGYRQKAPFRLAKEPRMGKHHFLCLFWTWTLFCTPEVLETLKAQQIRGYEVCEAILHRTGQPSEVVSQLVFPKVTEPCLADVDKIKPERCPECGITKYAYHKRGYMHLRRDALEANLDVVVTHEWFGSGGHGGFREILISNRLASLILEKGWQGVALKPVELI